MEKHRFSKFYRVFKNDTKVTEVSFNDFIRVPRPGLMGSQTGNLVDEQCSFPNSIYSLPSEKDMYYGYEQRIHAMEMAKAGALKHIAALIAEGPGSIEKLYQYRFDHYEDLNTNLKDSAIRLLMKTSVTK
ncbi:hypothetical protein [Desertivirga arenae]|uniref:hypothetical protein n=1 Tax=Desertivirga arenae TaxID=2810309 RepID=UPI001A9710C3|nr:hypothetical protein [Pedobacter sp. SYSU D00823]